MKTPRTIVTWQPVLTDHQAYTYQALQKQSGDRVLAYVTALEDNVRKAQGWSDTRVSDVERILIPSKGSFAFCLAKLREHRNAIHVFASPFHQPLLMICLWLAARIGVEFYLISEPYSPSTTGYYDDSAPLLARLKAMLRPWLYRFYVGLIRRPLAGVFAISKLAESQYRRAGLSSEKIFPFGYFVPKESYQAACDSSRSEDSDLRCIFVGSLINRKGIDLLLNAMRMLHERGIKCTLDIYGPGDDSILSDCPNVFYRGTISFGRAQFVMSSYDLLILPSRYDGWGVVVNEALCSGIPTLCSDTVGAGVAAADLGAGCLFRSGDAHDLGDKLSALVQDQKKLLEYRKVTHRVAELWQPEVAAEYMSSVMRADVCQRANLPSPWYGAAS